MTPFGTMEMPIGQAVIRLVVVTTVVAIGMQLMESTILRWSLALGFPAVYIAVASQWPGRKELSVLHRQINAQWKRLPNHIVPSARRIIHFIAVSLSTIRDDADGCDVRDVSDDDAEKDVSILLRVDDSGKIVLAHFIAWDMSLVTFEALLNDATQRRLQPVELVARLINGRVVYLIATFGMLNVDQQKSVLLLIQTLNEVPNAKQLRPFKCRNFIQRERFMIPSLTIICFCLLKIALPIKGIFQRIAIYGKVQQTHWEDDAECK